jgi:phosphoribosylformylglycinamidine (FGAM) synthase-like amidotransferase family enzyme
MAWAFAAAGFEAVDVHMSDIISGQVSLKSFRGIAACGGFSYGDVLGAGNGWAKSILLHHIAREEFETFFNRDDTFALGVCNGCQFFSQLKMIIPGAEDWPAFKVNRSERFEARVSTVRIEAKKDSIFFKGMDGSLLPVAVAHGEGRAAFDSAGKGAEGVSVPVRYVDGEGVPTEKYPLNPNGSPDGIAAVESPNGRVVAIMPHPGSSLSPFACLCSCSFPELTIRSAFTFPSASACPSRTSRRSRRQLLGRPRAQGPQRRHGSLVPHVPELARCVCSLPSSLLLCPISSPAAPHYAADCLPFQCLMQTGARSRRRKEGRSSCRSFLDLGFLLSLISSCYLHLGIYIS